jgi:hypothetical protein
VSAPFLRPQHEVWRLQYRANRYARHLSQLELNARIRDIFLNQLRVGVDGKVALISITEETSHWPVIWTHVLEEMRLRHGPFPAGFSKDVLHSEPLPDFASELAAKAANAMAKLRVDGEPVLIKFGNRIHMEALFAHGRLRIQPASFFRRQEHLGAVRDDELRIQWSLALSREDMVHLVRNPQDVPADAPDQRAEVKFHAPSDYWLYCVSAAVEPRLFVDFGAEACVVIHNRDSFSERLRRAASEVLPSSKLMEGAALYVDPLRPNTSKVFVPLAKHFRYAYQKEYRFAWLPRRGLGDLVHVDLAIGAIDDVARLVVL